MTVLHASQAFGSELRLRLIRHYLEHPGSQAEAARALGVSTGTITPNTQALMEIGVVMESPAEDRRTRIYSVNVRRYDELVQALHDYAHKV